jgi:hypothetical protein
MLTHQPVLKIGAIVAAVTLTLCVTIGLVSYWISSRPIYLQYNTGTDGKPVNNITVSATGKVSVSPDLATFDAGYSSKKATIAALQKDLTDKNNDIIAALKTAGVDAKDIQTTSFDMQPSIRYDWTTGKRYDDGVQGNITLHVKVRQIAKTGEIIDKAVNAGANTVSSISFTLENPETTKSAARKLAAQAARTKAGELAENSGVAVGGLVSISEVSYDYQPIYYNTMQDYATSTKSNTGSTTQVSGGSLEYTITVNATYGIK